MIELRNIAIRAGSFALRDVNLSIAAGTYAVLMGGTGQGKTTILEAICGLKPVAAGSVILGGEEMTRRKPADRGVGYVPQDLGLFPMMTVRGHLELALRVRSWAREEIDRRVDELAQQLGIEHLLARRPQGLSGGEAQRVALGRALSFRPRILLMDEPLNALDEATRDRLCEVLTAVQKQSGLATLHVTHSRVEARALADKLFVLTQGRIEARPLSDADRILPDSEPTESSPVAERQAYASGSTRQ